MLKLTLLLCWLVVIVSSKYTKYTKCGRQNIIPVTKSPIEANYTQAAFGEFPWMAAVYSGNAATPLCGGALIHPHVVMTSARCIRKAKNSEDIVKVRVGEWDLASETESFKHMDFYTTKTISHSSLLSNKKTIDIGLIILPKAVPLGDHINTVCLPKQNAELPADCLVSGEPFPVL